MSGFLLMRRRGSNSTSDVFFVNLTHERIIQLLQLLHQSLHAVGDNDHHISGYNPCQHMKYHVRVYVCARLQSKVALRRVCIVVDKARKALRSTYIFTGANFFIRRTSQARPAACSTTSSSLPSVTPSPRPPVRATNKARHIIQAFHVSECLLCLSHLSRRQSTPPPRQGSGTRTPATGTPAGTTPPPPARKRRAPLPSPRA